MSSLDYFINPVAEADFFQHYWENAPLICVRNDSAERFKTLISLHDFDRIVSCSNLHYPSFRLFKRGTLISACTTQRQVGPFIDSGLADLNLLYAEYAQGATVVLQSVERHWEPLSAICRDLGRQFGCPVQAYAYLSPESGQGPAAHYDTHDVFVLQIEGSKTWRIWNNPRPLPLRKRDDTYEPSTIDSEIEHATPKHEITLQAGDSLYIPRGFIHEACTSNSRSLHVSIGVMVYRWIDLLSLLIESALEECRRELEFRQALALGRKPGSLPTQDEVNHFRDLTTPLLKRIDLRRGLSLIRDNLRASTTPSQRGRLLDLQELDEISSQTICYRRPLVVFDLNGGEDRMALTFNAVTIEFDAVLVDAIRFVTSSNEFRVAEIPGQVDMRAKTSLVKKLIAEGFLTLRRWDSDLS